MPYKDPEKRKANGKRYKEENKEKIAAANKAYREAHKEEIAAKQKIRYLENREEILAHRAIYYINNRDKVRARAEKYASKNKEKVARAHKVYRSKNKERLAVCSAEYYRKADKEHRRVRAKIYRDKPESKKRKAEYQKKYDSENPHKVVAKLRMRRGALARQTPIWYGGEEELVKAIYLKRDELSKIWGVTLHVDHVVPINNPHVSGLHTWANLQLLEASVNLSKRNSFSNHDKFLQCWFDDFKPYKHKSMGDK